MCINVFIWTICNCHSENRTQPCTEIHIILTQRDINKSKVHYFIFLIRYIIISITQPTDCTSKVIRQLSLYILKTGVHSHLQKCITIKKKHEMKESRKRKRPLATLHHHQLHVSCFPIRFAIISILTPHLHFPMKVTRSTSNTHLIITAGSGLPCDWSVCTAPSLPLQSFSGCFCPYFPCGFFFSYNSHIF